MRVRIALALGKTPSEVDDMDSKDFMAFCHYYTVCPWDLKNDVNLFRIFAAICGIVGESAEPIDWISIGKDAKQIQNPGKAFADSLRAMIGG